MNEENKEPRYHVSQFMLWDNWQNREVNWGDKVRGHQCSYEMPERFVPKEDER